MKPLISVMIPTRNRITYLQDSVDSFYDQADDPRLIEVIVRIHLSDHHTIDWSKGFNRPIRCIYGDDAEGYRSIPRFVNCMAAMAYGEYLWAGSDDAMVVTKGWDTILLDSCAKPLEEMFLINPQVQDMPHWKIPVLTRALYDLLGTCGESPHSDCYLDALTHFAGIQKQVPITMKKWPGLPLCTDRDIQETWNEYRSPCTVRRFLIDKAKLEARLNRSLGVWTPAHAPTKPY